MKERRVERVIDQSHELYELRQQIETENSAQTGENDLYVELQEKIADLTSQNERLKQEVTQAQQEIGEVLLSARKQASQTINFCKHFL